jgi:hypothetical protein
VTPESVLAGDSVEIRVRLETGSDFSFDNSRIVFDLPAFMGTSRPTRHHQELSGFVELFCSDPSVSYTTRVWDMETGEFAGAGGRESHLGMAQRIVVVDFRCGGQCGGECGGQCGGDGSTTIEFVWGYLCDGFSTGTKVTTLVPLREFHNTIDVRYFADGTQGLPDYGRSFEGYERPRPDAEIALSFRILPREPATLRAIRQPQSLSLLVLDRFRNIARGVTPEELVDQTHDWHITPRGVFQLPDPSAIITPKELPLRDSPTMHDVIDGYNVYFGDLHTHTSFSIDCIEREKQSMDPTMSLRFGRESARLDFMALSDHHAPTRDGRHRLSREKWDLTREAVESATEPGEFVGVLGYEYRCLRGDTVVLFGDDVSYDTMSDSGIAGIEDLWRSYSELDFMTIPHFHNPGSLPDGEWLTPPRETTEPVLEIFSCHGSYERETVTERGRADVKKCRPDRTGEYFLKEGYRYGFVCNSDGHKGNPGSNGLTAVFARELTRSAIFDALRKRRAYGTTNARIRVVFTIDGVLMGSVVACAKSHSLEIAVAGDNELKTVDLVHNGSLFRRFQPDGTTCTLKLDIAGEAGSDWYVRVTQVDNHIAYSSPIWIQ